MKYLLTLLLTINVWPYSDISTFIPKSTDVSYFTINGKRTSTYKEKNNCVTFRTWDAKTINVKICGDYTIEAFNGAAIKR